MSAFLLGPVGTLLALQNLESLPERIHADGATLFQGGQGGLCVLKGPEENL